MISTDHMDEISWTDQSSLLLSRYGNIRRLDDPADWRQWAREANDLPSVRNLTPPDPEDHADWQGWAERFNQTISVLGV